MEFLSRPKIWCINSILWIQLMERLIGTEYILLQIELENLNNATDNINKLEIELDVSIKSYFSFHNILKITNWLWLHCLPSSLTKLSFCFYTCEFNTRRGCLQSFIITVYLYREYLKKIFPFTDSANILLFNMHKLLFNFN